MNNKTELIYFPSLSVGPMGAQLKKNGYISENIPFRFYSKEMPEHWRYPYFLITAGHFYKQKTIREDWGLQDCLVFGDSGGFQFATGAVKWDLMIRDEIFEWLENNADISCNIDIPPRMKYEGHFNDALSISYDNFKYFENKQSGKTKFLNVLHGTNPSQKQEWYNKVKDFQFNGWCLGSSQRVNTYIHTIAYFLQEKEFEKQYNKYIHVLGVSKITDFFINHYIQKLLNKKFDNKIQLMIDSSTPVQYIIYGNLINSASIKDLSYDLLHVQKNNYNDFECLDTDLFPTTYKNPASDTLFLKQIFEYTPEIQTKLMIHNTYMFINTSAYIKDLVTRLPIDILKETIPSELYLTLKSLDEMFESSTPMLVYEKYKNQYDKLGKSVSDASDKTILSDFFDSPIISKKEHIKNINIKK